MFPWIACVLTLSRFLSPLKKSFFFVSCISRIHPLFFYATNWRKKFDITENFWMLTNSVVLVAYLSALVLNMLLTSSILFNFWCFISTNEPIFIFANMVNDVPGTDDWHCESWHSLFYLQRRSCWLSHETKFYCVALLSS